MYYITMQSMLFGLIYINTPSRVGTQVQFLVATKPMRLSSSSSSFLAP